MDYGNKLLYEDEFQVNLEDLFIIDFNKLKLVLKTTLMNQDAMSNRIKELEDKIKNQSSFYNDHSQIKPNNTQENFQTSNNKNFSIIDIKNEETPEIENSPKSENENFSKLGKTQEHEINKFDISAQNKTKDKLPLLNENETENKYNIDQINNEKNINEEEINNDNNDKKENNKNKIDERNIYDNINDKVNDNINNTNNNQFPSSMNQISNQINDTSNKTIKENLPITTSIKSPNLKNIEKKENNSKDNNTQNIVKILI